MIDLRAFAGDRYRITLDPSAEDDTDHESRLWFFRIPCKYGFISVHGPAMLAAWTGSPKMVAKLIALDGLRVHQRGDREVRCLFPPERLDAVAELLQARRKRQVSEATRQRLIEVGAAGRFVRRTGQESAAP
jgi:hypothetical protein